MWWKWAIRYRECVRRALRETICTNVDSSNGQYAGRSALGEVMNAKQPQWERDPEAYQARLRGQRAHAPQARER